ncbi:MAG: lactate racemase domain-containing protein, partial [Anaerolineales bacterium]|nr:lactate racemase domain-containing protein [Anaerolineales bacterium]
MRTTTLSLAYGTRSLPVHLPTDNLLAVLETRPGQETPEEASLLAAALAQPIGAPRLGDLVRPGQKVAIVTSDLTRPCPSG